MERSTKDSLPVELLEENYHYPSALLHGHDHVMRFDGGDDILISTVPLTPQEKITYMAKFAVARAICTTSALDTVVAMARGETPKGGGFRYNVRRAWSSVNVNYNGLTEGDIELKAEEQGVYEIVFPFNEADMRAAIEAEKRGEPIYGLDAPIEKRLAGQTD